MHTRSTAALAAALAIALSLATSPAHGEVATMPEGATGLDAVLEQQVRQLAQHGAEIGARDALPADVGPAIHRTPRVEISLGQIDSRLRLAPCQQIEPYLPEGTRLWGRSRIGLRCTRGVSKWNIYLPVTVKVFATALVSTNGAVSGAVLTAADLTQAEVDLAEDPSAAVLQPDQAVGRVLARGLRPGQSLRQTHLKARQWFAAGDTVTISAQGEGFSVAGEGQALNNGVEGQPVRVRTESGRVISGLPVGDRRVELNL